MPPSPTLLICCTLFSAPVFNFWCPYSPASLAGLKISLKGSEPLYLISSDKRISVTACGWRRWWDLRCHGTKRQFRAWWFFASRFPCFMSWAQQFLFLSARVLRWALFVFIFKHCLAIDGPGTWSGALHNCSSSLQLMNTFLSGVGKAGWGLAQRS